jgi:hypothetical protein
MKSARGTVMLRVDAHAARGRVRDALVCSGLSRQIGGSVRSSRSLRVMRARRRFVRWHLPFGVAQG